MIFREVKHQTEKTNVYLGSPGLIELPDGALIASFDHFEPDPRRGMLPRLTLIYRSEDGGDTWQELTHMIGATWGTLFLHDGALWHLSVFSEYGDIVLRRSDDGGLNWTFPHDESSGLLFRGGPGREMPNHHFGGVTPVLFHNGRIYKSCELFHCPPGYSEWSPEYFQAAVISAPLDSDLLNAANWTMSRPLPFDADALNACRPGIAGAQSGWLEGNVLEAPDGSIVELMRIHLNESNHAALLQVSESGEELFFDPASGVIDFPGGIAKFTVRYDEKSRLYYTLSNPIRDPAFPMARNVLTLSCSPDLRHWYERKDLLWDDTGLVPELSARLTGFQYADWRISGDDLLYLVRAAYRGAHDYHDSNRILFGRLKNFRLNAAETAKIFG